MAHSRHGHGGVESMGIGGHASARGLAALLPVLLVGLSGCGESQDSNSTSSVATGGTSEGVGGAASSVTVTGGRGPDGFGGMGAGAGGTSASGGSSSESASGSGGSGGRPSAHTGGASSGDPTGFPGSGGALAGGSASSGGVTTGGSTSSPGTGGAAMGGRAASGGSTGSGGAATGGIEGGGGAAVSVAGSSGFTGETSLGGAGGATGASGAGGEVASGGVEEEGTPALHWVGRVDQSNPDEVLCAWSGCGVIARFQGTGASVRMGDTLEYTVVVDGEVQPKLTASSGTNVLAENLAPGTHVVELYRRVEAHQGESRFLEFDFGAGNLLAPPAGPSRRIEIIGDSITCGYGNEGADQSCGYTPETENHYLTYGAIAARNLGAELSTIAWSGKGVVCNYGDEPESCTDAFPGYYGRTLPQREDSQWDFSSWQADAVVVNLGTNDFSTDSDPTEAEFESAYQSLLETIRARYPGAFILCTIGPLLSGADLSSVRTYIQNVVADLNNAGDQRVSVFDIEPTDGSEGYGCDWHPSLTAHQRMADEVTGALASALGW